MSKRATSSVFWTPAWTTRQPKTSCRFLSLSATRTSNTFLFGAARMNHSVTLKFYRGRASTSPWKSNATPEGATSIRSGAFSKSKRDLPPAMVVFHSSSWTTPCRMRSSPRKLPNDAFHCALKGRDGLPCFVVLHVPAKDEHEQPEVSRHTWR